MSRPPEPALYICYLEIDEPLVETQVLAYVAGLARQGFAMHLLTFEKSKVSARREAEVRSRLRQHGIEWHHLRYHKAPSLPATLFDIAQGAALVRRLRRRHALRLLHGRSHVGAAMAARAAGPATPWIFDVRGLLADEYADAGRWSRRGVKYRLTKQAERALLRRAYGLVFLTHAIESELAASGVLSPSTSRTVIPCCVDFAPFREAAADRDAERFRRGWTGRRVLLYLGKLGGWYLDEELVRFFAEARRVDPRYFLQVATQSDTATLRSRLATEGVPAEAFSIVRCEPADVPRLAVAADVGLSLIRTCYSKRSSSPTRVGEYLASGLPVLSTPQIGDCDQLLGGHRVGVLLERFDAEHRQQALTELDALLSNPTTPARCRAVAEQELSLEAIGTPRYASLYRKLLGS